MENEKDLHYFYNRLIKKAFFNLLRKCYLKDAPNAVLLLAIAYAQNQSGYDDIGSPIFHLF